MGHQITIALFRTLGNAEDGRNRLLRQGVAERDLDLCRLTKDTTVPPEATPQTLFSFVDWGLGNGSRRCATTRRSVSTG